MIATISKRDGKLHDLETDRVIVTEANCKTDILAHGGYAPRIFVEVDQKVIESHINPTICTVTVKCEDGKTAVVHFGVRCRDGKVQGDMCAGSLNRDVTKLVSVPIWSRKYVKGGGK